MKRLLVLACIALGGCSTISTLQVLSGASVTPNQVYVAGNAYVAAEATAQQYLQLPLCPTATKICRTQAGAAAVVNAIWTARQAVNAMEAYATANPGAVVPVSLYNTAVTAITALQSAITQYNIKG